VKAKSKIPIIGNGDIQSASRAVEKLKTYELDGVMIGRGCLKNPWIFAQSRKLMAGESIEMEKDFIKTFLQLRRHLERECDDRIVYLQLKKFAAWFSAGYPGASAFRKNLFQCATHDDLVVVIQTYFEALKLVQQVDTSQEAFLMGGHG
jgi:tRNA-dihydrouridine synthase B